MRDNVKIETRETTQGRKTARPIYLDYQATTPTDPRVVRAMLPWFHEHFGNPHSSEHAIGWEAEGAVEAARKQVAALIGAKGRDVIFTSGATESNNLAIKGAARHRRAADGRDHVIVAASEHKCVLESAARLEREGFRVTRIGVGPNGLIDPADLHAILDPRTALVSVMAANNEIGVIQPLAEIGAAVREAGAWFHTDAAQAFGKIPLDVNDMCIDLLSISGHKVYGPMGIGALFIRGARPRVTVEPLMDGGGQERGLRSGTVPTPLVVGLGEAARIASAEMEEEAARLSGLRDRFLERLRERLGEGRNILKINGDMDHRLAGNLNLTFDGIESQDLMTALDGVAVSSGSACSSGAAGASHVLRAIGLDPARVAATIRVGFGRFTTTEEIDAAADSIAEAVARLTNGISGVAGSG